MTRAYNPSFSHIPRAAAFLAACVALTYAPPADAYVFADPANFHVKRTFTGSGVGSDLDLPPDLGGIHFSADGGTLYVVGAADRATSALYAVPVTRDAGTDEITGLGPAAAVVKLFDGTLTGLDAGLDTGPAGTLFYTYWDANRLAERPGGVAGTEALFDMTPLGLPVSIAGLTFSPFRTDPMTGFARLQVSTYDGGDPDTGPRNIYDVTLSPAGGGLFSPVGIALFAALPLGPPMMPLGAASGLHYVPGGPLGGSLMYTSWDVGEVHYLDIDPATGLAIDATSMQPMLGTTNPRDHLFLSDLGAGPLGLDFDPVTNDLFLATFQGVPSNVIFQISGFAGPGPTTTTSPTSTSTTTLTSSTTTTTLPAGCEATATFESVRCRLDRLVADIQDLGDIGIVSTKVLGKLQSVRNNVTTSEQLLQENRRRGAKGQLAKGARRMGRVRKLLRSRGASGIPEGQRSLLIERAMALRDDLGALRAGI